MKPIETIDDPRYVKAMSHPIRVRILGILERQAASPVEIARVVDVSLGTVAYHMRTLADLGLVELDRETRRRGAIEHHYRAAPRPRATASGWSGASPIGKQAAIGAGLQLVDELACRSAAAGGFDHDDAALERRTLVLDAPGLTRARAALASYLEELEAIEREAGERLRDAPDEGQLQTEAVALLFERGVEETALSAT